MGWGIAVALALLLAAPYVRWAASYRGDDYMITLRYARNAADGLGAVYNEGIRVQGFTSPLQFLVATALSLFGFGLESLPAAVSLLGLAGILALGVNLNFWINRKVSYAGLVVALCLILSSALLFEHVGFDSIWAAAFGATSLSLFWTRRYRAAGITAALAVLSRHDMAILPCLLVGVLLVTREWRGIRRFCIPFVILTLPWYLFAWIYYGSPLPNTLARKMAQGRGHHPALAWTFGQSAEYPFHWYPLNDRFLMYSLLALTGIAVLFGVWKFSARRKTDPESWGDLSKEFIRHPLFLFALLSTLHLVAYYLVLRVPASFGWYHVYFTTAILALAGAGAIRLASRAEQAAAKLLGGESFSWSNGAFLAAGICALTLAGLATYRHWAHHIPRDNPGRWRYEGYRAAAEWVTAHASPSDRIFVGEIGVFGWYCPLFIYDASSLVMQMPPLDQCDFRYGVWQDDPMFPPPIPGFRTRMRILGRFPGPHQVDIMVFEWKNPESRLGNKKETPSPDNAAPEKENGAPD